MHRYWNAVVLGAALLVSTAAADHAVAQQTVAPAVSPTVIPPTSQTIPTSPATPVTPLAGGATTAAPVVPPEQIAPVSPLAGSGFNPAMNGGAASTPLSGPPINPLPGHAGLMGTKP